MKALHALMKVRWVLTRPRTFGAHALALTPAGRIVLVRLRYADGWRLPGGGRAEGEPPEEAVLRELREEIGMTRCGKVQRACDLEEHTDFKLDLSSLLIVRDVEYRPRRWSWEVEDVREASIDELPADLSPRAAKWIRAVLPKL
jgi:8-oxo-dGTP pyrophosphatase MutT (NUDIX family)